MDIVQEPRVIGSASPDGSAHRVRDPQQRLFRAGLVVEANRACRMSLPSQRLQQLTIALIVFGASRLQRQLGTAELLQLSQ